MARPAEPVAYVNGEFLPLSQAKISVFDRALRAGDHVYEVERTFRWRLFKLEEHMERLYRALRYTRIDPGISKEQLSRVTERLVDLNRPFLRPNDDIFACQVITRGLVEVGFDIPGVPPRGATVIVYPQRLNLGDYAKYYLFGRKAVIPSIRRVPPQSLSPKVKIANKMSLVLAWLEAKEVDPEAVGLVLDIHGNITSIAPGASFLFVSKGIIYIPNRRNVLASSSMATTLELADKLAIPSKEGDYTPFDVYTADEAFLMNSYTCILPVVSLNGQKIGDGRPGPIYKRLLAAWNELVGLDIVEQALSQLPEERRRALMAEVSRL